MTGEKVVDEMITIAATKAEITSEQSRTCITAALQFIQKQTISHGPIDLSSIGFFCVCKTFIPEKFA